MEVFESGKQFLTDIATCGASWRLRNWVERLEEVKLQVGEASEQMEAKRHSANQIVEGLANVKRHAVKSLKNLRTISTHVSVRERDIKEHRMEGGSIDLPLAKVENTITGMEMAMHGAKGAGAGISTALGAWALIGTFGTASTGTAIFTLSGAAATNATLAWLGGGALAAGSGMAVGTIVLGGLVLVPALVIAGAFSHLSVNKKVNEIEAAVTEALRAIATYKKRPSSSKLCNDVQSK